MKNVDSGNSEMQICDMEQFFGQFVNALATALAKLVPSAITNLAAWAWSIWPFRKRSEISTAEPPNYNSAQDAPEYQFPENLIDFYR
ncbi:MAG: hypothetical protein AAF192_10350 [Pseudomonadota bacterium]